MSGKMSCIENGSTHVHIKLPIGAKFTGFCPQNDKSTCFNIIVLFNNPHLT